MTVSYFVRYEGNADDLPAFLRYYRERHVPILSRWPGLRRVVLHTPVPWDDPFPVRRGGAVLMAQIEFETEADLAGALRSAERAEARQDLNYRFPAFHGTVIHQALAQDELWRSPWLDGNEEQA